MVTTQMNAPQQERFICGLRSVVCIFPNLLALCVCLHWTPNPAVPILLQLIYLFKKNVQTVTQKDLFEQMNLIILARDCIVSKHGRADGSTVSYSELFLYYCTLSALSIVTSPLMGGRHTNEI